MHVQASTKHAFLCQSPSPVANPRHSDPTLPFVRMNLCLSGPWQNTRFDPSLYYDTYARTMGGEVGIAPCDPFGRGQTWVFRPNGMEIAVRDSNIDGSKYLPYCLDAISAPGSLKLRPCGSTATIHLVKPPEDFDESFDGSDLVDRNDDENDGDGEDDSEDDSEDDFKPDRQDGPVVSGYIELSSYKNPLTGKGKKKMKASSDKDGVDKNRQVGIKSFGLQTAVTDEAEDVVWYGGLRHPYGLLSLMGRLLSHGPVATSPRRRDELTRHGICCACLCAFCGVLLSGPWFVFRYLGGRNPYSWNPEDQSLGGSEQAVVELSAAWVGRGLTVAVYGQFSPSRVYRSVVYRDVSTFRGDLQYKNLIIWRAIGADLFNPGTSPRVLLLGAVFRLYFSLAWTARRC